MNGDRLFQKGDVAGVVHVSMGEEDALNLGEFAIVGVVPDPVPDFGRNDQVLAV
jgi:hypothetical protein